MMATKHMTTLLSAILAMIFATSAIAAPIANAPLATPILVDSTGKAMGRYVDMNLLITVNGETVALPLRQRTVFVDSSGDENKIGPYSGTDFGNAFAYNLSNRAGLDWQEGVLYSQFCLSSGALIYGVRQLPLDNTKFYTYTHQATEPQVPRLSKFVVQIFGTGAFSLDKAQVMYASIARADGPRITRTGDYLVQTAYNYGICHPTPAGSGFPSTVVETNLINLDNIGIAPFFVQ